MKAALFYGGKDIRYGDWPTPEPGPGEVLVKVLSAGICGSDLHGYRDPGRAAAMNREVPYVTGHELAGTVAALGAGVTHVKVGQRVAVEPLHLLGCGKCRYCQRGDYELCRTIGTKDGQRIHSTGFAEYSVEAGKNVFPLADHVNMDQASILDVYACGVHAQRLAPVTEVDYVAIQGAGAIGLTAAEMFRMSGAKDVIILDVVESSLQVARNMGFHSTVNSSKVDPVQAVLDLTEGEGAQVVVEAVGGMAPTFETDCKIVAPAGRILIIGSYGQPQTLQTRLLQRKEANIQLLWSYGLWKGVPEFKVCLDLLTAGKLLAAQYVTHTFPLSRTGEGFEAAVNKNVSGAIKVVINPPL
jgi:threonine dehydrogenase-like Zn-dependent dehydrogenase